MVDVAALTRQSRLIFRGTVERVRAATMPSVPVSEDTVVVRVDEVFQAPPGIGDQTGNEITVQLSGGELDSGAQAVFFTNPWMYGDSIAVVEVGRQMNQTAEAREMGARIAEVAAGLPDEELKRHLASAVLVIVGRVVNTQPLATAALNEPPHEHDPEWWVATVAVDSVEKGEVADPTVRVLYAGSMDVMWHETPKLQVGEQRILLLHTDQLPEAEAGAYTALHPMDVQPVDQLERVRRLLDELGDS